MPPTRKPSLPSCQPKGAIPTCDWAGDAGGALAARMAPHQALSGAMVAE